MADSLYLEITNGVTSVMIADGEGGETEFKLHYGMYAPAVASLRRSDLDGSGPYSDVVETRSLNITGASVTEVLNNLATLNYLLDQAERWSRGLNVTPVIIKYSPKGATVSSLANPLQAVLLGRAPDAPALQLPQDFEVVGENRYIVGVRVTLVRQGEWKHTNQGATSAAVDSGEKVTVTMPDGGLSVPGPTDVVVNDILTYAKGTTRRAYLVLSEAADNITILDAEGANNGAAYTSVADAGSYARNANVLRYTPTVTTEVESDSIGIAAMEGIIGWYANVRNNSALASFALRLRVRMRHYADAYTAPTTIATALNTPTWVPIGWTYIRSPWSVFFNVRASVVNGSLDIDSLVAVNFSAAHSMVLGTTLDNGAGVGTAQSWLNVEQRRLSARSPIVYLSIGSNPIQLPDSSPVFFTAAENLTALLLATGGDASANTWRQVVSSAVITNTFTLSRYAAYLAPI